MTTTTEISTVVSEFHQELPLLPLRDVVVFPHMVIPLFVGRPKSIKALEYAVEGGKSVLLVAQKSAAKEDPSADDLYQVGCVVNVLQMLKLPDGTVKVLVEGVRRGQIHSIVEQNGMFMALVEEAQAPEPDHNEIEALRRALMNQFDQYVKLNKRIPPEVLSSLVGIVDGARLADTVAAHLALRLEQKQEVLEVFPVAARLEKLLSFLEAELDILQVEKRIRGRVKRQMEKSQREYYLNEQVKAIQKELGEDEDGVDLEDTEKRIRAARMGKEATTKALAELKKLKLMSPMSAEATVVRNYLETLLALPWQKRSRVSKDINASSKVLEQDHYGLDKVKDRILEYLAVQQRVKKLKGPILCLVGPPGVGKTSLGQSIARATNRKFVRMSLGGVRDEAEIRGHRRTYIGSMPGKILQSMSKVGVKNPLFLLDEVDKMGMDFRGDPSSALLEVLDPEQNSTFVDHYAEVEFDLSDVMFVATANTLKIPPALYDRMEVIRLSGYTEEEKIHIGQRYLIPKQLKANGLKSEEISITEEALVDTIRYYTHEAGVRGLEREISKLCRKLVKQIVMGKRKNKLVVNSGNLEKFLGVRRYTYGVAEKENQIGQVNGLAWTEVGGELLNVEAVILDGKGKHLTTGTLGDVMQESIQAAITVVRKRSAKLGIKEDFYQNKDIHVHLPEGATPKDGPSAGIAIATAVTSALTGIPVLADVAMTGEITLRGEVLAIGGLKEKLLAARRGHIRKVLIPKENVKDLAEIPEDVKASLEIVPVKWFDQVLEQVLESQPVPLPPAAEPVPIEAVAESDKSNPLITH